MTEAELVARARTDARAFEALYDEYFPRVYYYLLKHGASDPDAQELAQTVFLKIYQNLDRYQPTGRPFAAWVFTITRNTLIDFRRRLTPALDDELSERPDLVHTDEYARLELQLDIQRVLDRLPAAQRHAVVLRFMEGLDYRTVGERLGRSEGAAKALVSRALQALEREIKWGDLA